MKILPLLGFNSTQKRAERHAQAYRELIRKEAKIGGQLFGPVPAGHRREFFCLDQYTWIWHEEWTDDRRQHRVVTTRYDVRPNAVLKAQDNQPYQPVPLAEAINLYQAVELYEKRVGELYRTQPQAA
ncbi:MAG: hypothetical protein ABI602_01495 [Candidatus Saccharibacteria bacterium]